MFSGTTCSSWVAHYLEYSNDITTMLNSVVNLRNKLIYYAQCHGTGTLTSVLEALPSQHHLPRWILSTAISSDASAYIFTTLRFITDPIEQQFTELRSDFPRLIEHLSIDTHFRLKIVDSLDTTWSTPFSVNFSLWESIREEIPQKLAESKTEAAHKLFLGISVGQIARNEGRVFTRTGHASLIISWHA
jgi:hypothetical protein